MQSLRDARWSSFSGVASRLPDVVARRARHVVTEDDRVKRVRGREPARRRDSRMGKLMVESHRSLQHDYEVSCAELDFLVDAALGIEGVYGSRMTGGGFGGCTVTLLRAEAAGDFRTTIARNYEEKFGVVPAIYPCEPSEGAGEVKKFEQSPRWVD